MKTAKDIMTTSVLTILPNASVKELAELLMQHNINGVPVTDTDGELLGVVTENDLIYQKKKVHIPTVLNILDSIIYLESPEKMKKEMQKIAGTTVADIFTKPAVTVASTTPIDEIATIMAEKKIHTLPVIENNTLVGIIGKGDIIKTLIK